MGESYKVAVIGGGMAGLLTAKELRREGHRVTVFEKADKVGGIWRYDSRVETDPLGLDPNREIVHSSLYGSLRINIPRRFMGSLDYPFLEKEGGDPRSFPGHEEVLGFIEDFARDFRLMELIRFGHEVVRVERVDEVSQEWVVGFRIGVGESRWESKEQVFEAVVICTVPRIAEFPGRDTWPGLQLHSHNYRTPEQFKNKIVVVIGNGSSATDILKEISPLAKQVHQTIRRPDFQSKRLENHNNAWQHPRIECAHKDGKIVFEDGSIVDADIIIHCTGYKYSFPFLRSNGIVTVDDNRAMPGMVIELQAKWIAKVLSGKVKLATQEEMTNSVEQHYRRLEERGWPKHYTHNLEEDEFEYKAWLAAESDISLPELWKEISLSTLLKARSDYGSNYRDTWDVDKWIQTNGFL
ncbi:hypothetical protein GQ457_06G032850 [Hibiscus cannabinus]